MNGLPSQIFEFGEFRVDAVKRQLSKGTGGAIPLTPKVFDTLLYLVRNSGKTIGKDELMREIWTDTIVEENNLSQNISILRRALGEKAGDGRFIATVPGHGFRFVPEVRLVEEEQLQPSLPVAEISDDVVPASMPPADARKPFSVRYALIGGLVLIAVISLAFYVWRENAKLSAAGPVKTIAILPFKPLVAENRDEALEIGMADTLIARLGNNRELLVRPLSSVRRFGQLDQDAVTAGRALDVDAVLDGSLQRWGDGIRVNARLIKVSDGSLIWTGTFDEKFTDIFAVQDAIANKVASALALRLSGDEKKRLTRRSTENVEAYQLYLRGRFHVFKLTPPEIQKGIEYFQQAIEIDPAYALAYAGLSDAYRSLALGSEMPPVELFARSKAASEKAIELDDSLAEGHSGLGMTIFWGDWNWDAAESQFKRALELNPNSAEAHLFYAHLLSNTGRHPDALAEAKLARELNPLFPFAGALEGQFLLHAGQPDEALARLRKTSELEPRFWMPYLFAASVYIEKGMYAEAVAEARRARELSPVLTIAVAYGGYALAKAGRLDEARASLDELLKLSNERFVPASHIAMIYNGLGDQDNTFIWLERGFEQRDPKMNFLKVEPKWNNLRNEPRFIKLMQRLKFD